MHQIAVFKSWDDRLSKGNFHWRNISHGSFPCDSSRLFLATTQLQSPGRLKSNHALDDQQPIDSEKANTHYIPTFNM